MYVSPYLHNGSALELNDFNNDRVFDIGDAILMYKAIKANKESMKENYYTVIFLDFEGNVISRQSVKENEDATVPEFDEVAGYTFDYLSKSNKGITGDAVIKAVYKAN